MSAIYGQIDPYSPWKIVVNSFSSLEPSGPQGGLIVYQFSVVRRRRCMSIHNVQMSSSMNSFIIKLHIEHPLEGGGVESLSKWSRSHDQDGHHLFIW